MKRRKKMKMFSMKQFKFRYVTLNHETQLMMIQIHHNEWLNMKTKTFRY